jgi:hypothetical protein
MATKLSVTLRDKYLSGNIYANENFSTTELNKKHNQKPKNKTEAEADKIRTTKSQ